MYRRGRKGSSMSRRPPARKQKRKKSNYQVKDSEPLEEVEKSDPFAGLRKDPLRETAEKLRAIGIEFGSVRNLATLRRRRKTTWRGLIDLLVMERAPDELLEALAFYLDAEDLQLSAVKRKRGFALKRKASRSLSCVQLTPPSQLAERSMGTF